MAPADSASLKLKPTFSNCSDVRFDLNLSLRDVATAIKKVMFYRTSKKVCSGRSVNKSLVTPKTLLLMRKITR